MKQQKLTRCPLCGGKKIHYVFKVRDYRFCHNYQSNLVKCIQCGFVYLNPRPFKKEISKYYPQEYFQKEINLAANHAKILYNEIYYLIKKFFPNPGKVLDLGCGKGILLHGLKRKRWECIGVELSKQAAQNAKKLIGIKNIINKDIDQVKFKQNSFDLIILHHVLEHIYQPKQILKKINHWLKNNGIVLVVVPNFNSLTMKIFKDKTYSLDIPRHLYQFSDKTLEKLLAKVNFKLIEKSFANRAHNLLVLRESISGWHKHKSNLSNYSISLTERLWLYLTRNLKISDTIIAIFQKQRN